MFKTILALMILLLSGISYGQQEVDITAEKEAIKAVIKKQIEVFHARDFEVYKDVWAHKPFIVRMFPSGLRYTGWDTVGYMYQQNMKNNPDKWENFKYDITDLNIHVQGNYAWVIHNQHAEGIVSGSTSSYDNWNVRFLEKISGTWKITFHITGPFSPKNFAAIESEINTLGYQLLKMKKFQEAIKLFKLNVEYFPDSWNVYDSLAEAYMKNGNNDLAIKNYEKSLELNSENKNASEMLKKLREK